MNREILLVREPISVNLLAVERIKRNYRGAEIMHKQVLQRGCYLNGGSDLPDLRRSVLRLRYLKNAKAPKKPRSARKYPTFWDKGDPLVSKQPFGT